MVADISEKQSRTKGMVFIGLAYSIGFIVGPIGSVYVIKLLHFDQNIERLTYIIGVANSLINLLNLFILFTVLPTTKVNPLQCVSLH